MITVVTPCYNQGEYLSEAIESILAQTFTEFEYLLLDDGSIDATWEVMQKYGRVDSRIRCNQLHKQRNVGVILNQSIREAQGDYWVWCPADDRLMPDLLEKKWKYSREYSQSVVYSEGAIIDGEGNGVPGRWGAGDWTPEEFAELVWATSPIGFTGIWIPMETFDRVGNFPTHLQCSEDFEWMIRATIHGVEFRGMSDVLFQKRVHANRTTDRNQSRIVKQVDVIRESLRTYQRLWRGLDG